jgi:putative transposase
MQPLRAHHMAHEAEEYPAMSQSTTEIRIVPLVPSQDVLTDLLRDGARRLLAQAIEAEVASWIDDHAHLKDDQGRRQVVRNGHLPERAIPTGIGAVNVQQPRVRDRRPADQREAFSSAILPPYLRKTKSLEGLLPWLYLKGVSTGDFSEALQAILGPDAPGLSATTITRLKATWEDEFAVWNKRSLAGKHLRLRLGRRGPLQHPLGGWAAVHPGADGGDRRGEEGADRRGRRLSHVWGDPT